MSGLEFAARYTHQWADGRTETVTLIHHETPGDREWALERVAEMVRAQASFGRSPDAHLLVRRAATEWTPEETSVDANVEGLGPWEPYQDAIRQAIATKKCWCEYVDIGVGSQRVTNDPECPVHSEAGAAGHYLVALIPVAKRHAQRGDAVEAWIKAKRDAHVKESGYWWALDRLLDEYRLHADYGTPLDKELSETAL
ncbi:hypothetical protein [Streptosporangium sp. NPDC049078]|uniref:hypothetical protein n=1 Tax=Streptosporangium sp. NPDC049078 TaxID=3155767 RepID=UPI003417D622